MDSAAYDVAVIGGGIVGLASALALTSGFRLRLTVLEAEDHLAAHQTGNNSGVIHSGIYYKPGSLKARNCVEGREALYRFCQEQGIPYDRCGKIVVATRESELGPLEELERRGKANGLSGLRRLTPEEIREHEPHAAGIAGLFVAETGIVGYKQVARAYARLIRERDGTIQTGARVRRVHRRGDATTLETAAGEVRCRHLINCGGLQSDRLARLCGVEPGVQIIPFRGEYYELVPERRSLVRNLIYPVPDPRFPFLGVHFTRMIGGGVEAGPNAVLALKREGYRLRDISAGDTLHMARYRGFWRMVRAYWKTGVGELYRSVSKRAFVKALQRLVPEIQAQDLHPSGAGVRAQAVDANGALVDDFRIVEAERMIHVLNAPSPAATASLSIGRTIAAIAGRNFQLEPGATSPETVVGTRE
jgi:L-2-hydroxyglutarate oxidase